MTYSQQELVARRVLARSAGRAQPLASAMSIGSDPDTIVGIVPIKIVTEEQIQAVGFGRLDAPPTIVTRIDPLGRDVSDLIPFANWMEQLGQDIVTGDVIRIWTPHRAAVECIDVLGHRFATNSQAPNCVRQMGRVCRSIASELLYADQPFVACASELLIEHFVTGQTPTEDRNLGSFLTWLNPPPGVDVIEAARTAARLPASSILPNIPGLMHDAEITRLRREAKRLSGTSQAVRHARIHEILEEAVQREWDLMVEARHHLISLPSSSTIAPDAVTEATQRLTYKLAGGAFRVVQPHSIAVELKKHERAKSSAERRAWRTDPLKRAAAIRRGKLLCGTIQVVTPSTGRGQRPQLHVSSAQSVLRIEPGTRIKLLDVATNFVGRVISVAAGAAQNERIIRIEIETGVRSISQLSAGATTVWEPAEVNLVVRETSLANRIKDRAPWLLSGSHVPAANPCTLPGADLLALASTLEKTP